MPQYQKEDWLIEILNRYKIDLNASNEEIVTILKSNKAEIHDKLTHQYRLSHMNDSTLKYSIRKNPKNTMIDKLKYEMDMIEDYIIIIEGRVEVDKCVNNDDFENIIDQRAEKINNNLHLQLKAKEGLTTMLEMSKDKKSQEEMKNLLNNVCLKIEVLKLQQKVLDNQRKKAPTSLNMDERKFCQLGYHLKIEEAVLKGTNRALAAIGKANKKNYEIAANNRNKCYQKINLLKSALEKWRQKNEEIIDYSLLFSKAFRLTGTLHICLMGCTDLNITRGEVHVVVLVDTKEVGRTLSNKPSDSCFAVSMRICVTNAREIQFEVYHTEEDVLYAVEYLLLEDLVDEKKHDVTYLHPVGKLIANIRFVNPLLSREGVNIRRRRVIPKGWELKGPRGENLLIWAQNLKGKKDSANKNQNKSSGGIDGFEMLAFLGMGTFGKVFLCRNSHNDKIYAVKSQKKIDIVDKGEIETLRIEFEILKLQNDFLISMFKTFQSPSHVFFVMELATGGDLMTLILRKKFGAKQTQFYITCVCLGLEFLHNNLIMYRDFKLENLMLCSDGYIKIADFGLSKENMAYGIYTNTFCGTPEFIAPEMLLKSSYSRSIDWWQFGVLLYEMVISEPPFSGDDEDEIFQSIVKDPLRMPGFVQPETKDLIIKLLRKQPSTRLGNSLRDAQDVMDHPYFYSIDIDSVINRTFVPPFIPSMKSKSDVSNFDSEFTRLKPVLSLPVRKLKDKDQDFFDEFYFDNL